jgi:hypothetical protein
MVFPFRTGLYRIFGSPAYDRLANVIALTWMEFDTELHRSGHNAVTEPWARTAYKLLLSAETSLANWQIDMGWAVLLAAQRAILSNPHNPEKIKRAAVTLWREKAKIEGWRAKAIEKLICSPDGTSVVFGNTEDELARIVDAVALRDDFFQNTWFRIRLRKRHLLNLFLILFGTLLLFLLLSWLKILPDFLSKGSQLTMVILFGILGAAVSVAQTLLAQDVADRIPVQQLGALVIWMRPSIGAAAALAVFAVLHTGKYFGLLGDTAVSDPLIAAFSFLAGYSQRFIVDVVGRLSQTADRDK